jgi:hypothetical protein
MKLFGVSYYKIYPTRTYEDDSNTRHSKGIELIPKFCGAILLLDSSVVDM